MDFIYPIIEQNLTAFALTLLFMIIFVKIILYLTAEYIELVILYIFNLIFDHVPSI